MSRNKNLKNETRASTDENLGQLMFKGANHPGSNTADSIKLRL